jgi:hypothetical protein
MSSKRQHPRWETRPALEGCTDARSLIGFLLAHGVRESLQSGHGQFAVLIHEAARAQRIDECRTLIAQSSAAEKLNQRSLLNPGQFRPDGFLIHRRSPLIAAAT